MTEGSLENLHLEFREVSWQWQEGPAGVRWPLLNGFGQTASPVKVCAPVLSLNRYWCSHWPLVSSGGSVATLTHRERLWCRAPPFPVSHVGFMGRKESLGFQISQLNCKESYCGVHCYPSSLQSPKKTDLQAYKAEGIIKAMKTSLW